MGTNHQKGARGCWLFCSHRPPDLGWGGRHAEQGCLLGGTVGIKEAPREEGRCSSTAVFWAPSRGSRHCAGYWGHRGNCNSFILKEPMVWKRQSLSSSHSAVSAPQRRTLRVLGKGKAGARIRPESQGRLPGGRSISAEKPARQGWAWGRLRAAGCQVHHLTLL